MSKKAERQVFVYFLLAVFAAVLLTTALLVFDAEAHRVKHPKDPRVDPDATPTINP